MRPAAALSAIVAPLAPSAHPGVTFRSRLEAANRVGYATADAEDHMKRPDRTGSRATGTRTGKSKPPATVAKTSRPVQ